MVIESWSAVAVSAELDDEQELKRMSAVAAAPMAAARLSAGRLGFTRVLLLSAGGAFGVGQG
jgi:hypothetical protein